MFSPTPGRLDKRLLWLVMRWRVCSTPSHPDLLHLFLWIQVGKQWEENKYSCLCNYFWQNRLPSSTLVILYSQSTVTDNSVWPTSKSSSYWGTCGFFQRLHEGLSLTISGVGYQGLTHAFSSFLPSPCFFCLLLQALAHEIFFSNQSS